jgi:predicted tellurium resistance membrane protein TerC
MLVMMDSKPDVSNNPVPKFIRKRRRVAETLHGQAFSVRQPDPRSGKLVPWAAPPFLCLGLAEIADLVFAVDSVPAILVITPDAFIVHPSNTFAILGLRALYLAPATVVQRFHCLKHALALVPIFVGAKIVLGDWLFDGKRRRRIVSSSLSAITRASAACGSTIGSASAFLGREATPKTSRSWTITEARRDDGETQARVGGRDARRGVPQGHGHEQRPPGEGIAFPSS